MSIDSSGLRNCPDCGVAPGEAHDPCCDVEHCSVCGGQCLSCDCGGAGHDPIFARWTGIWPGKAEADFLRIDLNTFYERGLHKIFFVKPARKQ